MTKFRKKLDSVSRFFASDYRTHNRIDISKSALLHNFDVLKEASGGLEPMPVLKSNAYGHGIELVAEALKERVFPYIAVDGYHEYLRVRRVSNQPVLVMGAIPSENISKLVYDKVAFMVQDAETVNAFGASGQDVRLHLDVDTGMNRYGSDISGLERILAAIKTHSNLHLEGVASHLADADNTAVEFTKEQGKRFDKALSHVFGAGFKPELIHISNSPGAPKKVSKYSNAFRPGLGLYGINPLTEGDAQQKTLAELRPALRFLSTVTAVRELEEGESVSYGRTYIAKKKSRIAVIPVGYYEALPRALSSKARLISKDHELKIAGRICMNHTMLEAQSAEVGDEVEVIGGDSQKPNSAAELSKVAGMIPYELLVDIAVDTRRRLVD